MIIVRRMESKDVDTVCKLEKEAFSMPWHKQSFLDMIENKNALYLVAVDSNTEEVIGCCGLLSIVGEGDISNVVVKKEFRNSGVGRELLKTILEIGKEDLNIEAFTLEVRIGNKPAINLYQSFGFISEGIRKNFYDKPKEDAMIMWKR